MFRDFKNVDYEPINEFLLSTNWVSELSNRSANDAASFFNSKLSEAIDKFIPFKTFYEHKFPLWVSPELKRLIFQKKQAHLNFKKSGISIDYNAFSELRAKFKYLFKSNYRAYIEKTERVLSNSPRRFWKYVRDSKQHLTFQFQYALAIIRPTTIPNLLTFSLTTFNQYSVLLTQTSPNHIALIVCHLISHQIATSHRRIFFQRYLPCVIKPPRVQMRSRPFFFSTVFCLFIFRCSFYLEGLWMNVRFLIYGKSVL